MIIQCGPLCIIRMQFMASVIQYASSRISRLVYTMFDKINPLSIHWTLQKYLIAIKVSKYSHFLYLVSCVSSS